MLIKKPGVLFDLIAPGGVRILVVLNSLSKKYGDLVITSGTDGEHSGPLDPHKLGKAYDVRSKNLSDGYKKAIVTELNEILGDKFYAFLENPNLDNEHIHIQVTKSVTYEADDLFKDIEDIEI